MDHVLIFKVIQFTVLAVFALLISDYRRKKDMVLSANRVSVVVLKITYMVPLCIYGVCLASLTELALHDLIALLLTCLGTLVVVKAKIDLGRHHTWTGYRLVGTQIVTHGIYSYVRNPLYVGIVVFILGGVCTGLPRVSWAALLAGSVSLTYVLSFLVLAAQREANDLAANHGSDYEQYRQQVHPFLPVGRYHKAA